MRFVRCSRRRTSLPRSFLFQSCGGLSHETRCSSNRSPPVPAVSGIERAESVVLIGAGVGITPMMSVVRYLTDAGWSGKVSLILGFRTPRDFIFREELEELKARNVNLSVTVTMSDPRYEPWSGNRGHIDATLLASVVEDIASCRAHICGPPSMMDAV